MVRLTPKRSPSESSGNFAPGSSACSMMARRSARQITLALSDGSAFLLAVRGAIGESRGNIRLQSAILYHTRPAAERLNCMQFCAQIAQIESLLSPAFRGFS
jgi:hypothetical protein